MTCERMRRKGFALVSVVIAFVIISAMALFFTNYISTDSLMVADSYRGMQAYYVAEGGFEYTLRKNAFPSYALNNMQLGQGIFNVYTSNYSGGTSVQIRSEGIVGGVTRKVSATIQRAVSAPGIAFDAASSAATVGAQNNLNWNHTVSGVSRLLLVGVSVNGITTVNTVTYNGIALTFVGALNNANNVNRVEIWSLVNPPLGNNPVNVTLTGVATANFVAGAVSLTNVDQTNPIEAQSFSSSNTATPSVTITTIDSDAWVFDVIASNKNITMTAAAGRVQRWNTSSGAVRGGGSTRGPVTPAGAVAMDWTLAGGGPNRSAVGAVAVKPAGLSTTIVVVNKGESM